MNLNSIIDVSITQQSIHMSQAGFGGIMLLALTILYLPNFMIATLAYIVGAGFAVGRGTLISPFTFNLGKIPALPILGALPTGKHPLFIALSIVVVLCGAAFAIWSVDSGLHLFRQTLLLFSSSAFLLAYLGSGALITYEMGSVGPSLWKFPLIISAEFLLGVGAIRVIPMLSRK